MTAVPYRSSGLLVTPSATEWVQCYAVSSIAVIAAESKVGGVPLAEPYITCASVRAPRV
jgi:hypothetical protein